MILGLLFITCNKYDQVLKEDHANEEKLKAWLKDNGGYYKNGIMLSGKNQFRLNWSKITPYEKETKNYYYIPFESSQTTHIHFGITFQTDKQNRIIAAAFTVDEFIANKTGYKKNHLQSYYDLDGKPLNVWSRQGDIIYSTMRKPLSKHEISILMSGKKSSAENIAEPILTYSNNSSDYCYYKQVVTYRNDSYMDQEGTFWAVVYPVTSYVLECISSGGGGGGGVSPGGGGQSGGDGGANTGKNYDYNEREDDVEDNQDPCANAKRAAEKIKNAYSQQALQQKLPQLTAPSTTEKGIALYERVKVDPHDNTNITSDHYYTGNIIPGTDTSITIPVTVSDLDAIIATSHYHPASGYSAPSANDIYRVIEANGYNTSQFTQGRFQGSFVEAADGSSYALKVTDATLANTFFGTQGSNLAQNGREWNPESDIGKDFTAANDYYLRKYGDSKTNQAYEEALGFVLNKYNTGVTLMKKDATGNFKPIIRTWSTTKNWLGIKTTTYINPCP